MAMRTVDAKTLKNWMDKGEAVLLDVREPAEHAAASIKGAVLMPLANVKCSDLPDCTGRKLVIHCQKGGRGGNACTKLLSEMPDLDVYNLEGGISAWGEAGLPVKKSGSFFLPLDRQVQLTIGIGVLLGSVFGYFLSAGFFILSGFFGLGLIVAGMTGFCGLAKLMAYMPWNKA